MGIINFKWIIVICAILFNINFAQTNNEIGHIKIDTVKHKNKVEKLEKQSLEYYKLIKDFNYHFSNSPLYIPDYITDSNSNWKYKNIYVTEYDYTKVIEKVNKSLHNYLAYAFGMKRNYDLGEFGKYLAATNKIVTIILWLLSF